MTMRNEMKAAALHCTARLFLAAFVVVLALPFAALAQESGPALIVEEPVLPVGNFQFDTIEVIGGNEIEDSRVIGISGLETGVPISAGEMNAAFQALSVTQIFRDVAFEPQGNRLIIRVQEAPFIGAISFEGNSLIKDEQLQEIVTSQVRRVYSPAEAEADAALLADVYRARGRVNAVVTPVIIRRNDSRIDLVFEINESGVSEIEKLAFVGNRAFSDWRLRQALATKEAGLLRQIFQSDTFIAERLELDKSLLRDFYLSRGYVDFEITDASAEFSRERDAVFVTFTVNEGQPFEFGEVSVVSEIDGLDTAEFAALLKSEPGDSYSPTALANDTIRLENLALEKSVRFVAVDPRITQNQGDGTLDVQFTLVRAPRVFVERIDIKGNTSTRDNVVRRAFNTGEGDPFNPRELEQAAERLRALGFFSNVEVSTRSGSAPDRVIVDVIVEDKPTGTLSFGGSYNFDTGLGYNIGFSESNFLGRGQSVGIQLSGGVDNSLTEVSFVEPGFLDRDLLLSFSAFYARSDQDNALYDVDAEGATIGIGFPTGLSSRINLHYNLSRRNLSNYVGLNVGGVQIFSPILLAETLRGAEITSSIGYTFSYDTRIGGLSPDRGVLLRFEQDFAGLGGDAKYVKTEAFALTERRVWNEELTLRAIFEAGAINTYDGYDTRVTDRFFATRTIRGFDVYGLGPRDSLSSGGVGTNEALGGNYFSAARFEAEFPLGISEELGLTGALFFDVGSLWGLNKPDGVNDSIFPRASVGASLIWDGPIGPLRFNFSHILRKQPYDETRDFDLTIATNF